MRRRIIRSLIALVILAGVFTGGGWPVYVDPDVDQPRKVDAILVIAGRQDGREGYALHLAEQGYAHTVLISNPYSDDYAAQYCVPRPTITVICFRPDPTTTRGEARELRNQAQQHHWTSAMVVTMVPHLSRARYIISRCFTGDLLMIPYRRHYSPAYWTYMYAYQTAGWIKAWFQSGC